MPEEKAMTALTIDLEAGAEILLKELKVDDSAENGAIS